jgi:hypothetical protein
MTTTKIWFSSSAQIFNLLNIDCVRVLRKYFTYSGLFGVSRDSFHREKISYCR